MKIDISVGGLWHANQLSQQLKARGLLNNLYTSLPSSLVPRQMRDNIGGSLQSFGYIDLVYLGMRKALRQDMAAAKAQWFDYTVSKRISDCDIFVSWSSFGARSMKRARELGAKVVLERGSSHIVKQRDLLNEAYGRTGLRTKKLVNDTIIERELEEYETADHIFVPSDFVVNTFSEFGLGNKLIKVPYGVDLADFQPAFTEGHFERKTLKICFAGIVSVRKGFFTILEAVNRLNERIEIDFILAGPISPEIMAYLKSNPIPGNITLLGKLSKQELIQVYQSSHLFILPSIEEGMARVVLEAMACGLVPVCSYNTGASEVVTDGSNGYIFEPYDTDKIVTSVMEMHSNRDKLMRFSAGASGAVRKYTWDYYGDNIVEQYKRILGRG